MTPRHPEIFPEVRAFLSPLACPDGEWLSNNKGSWCSSGEMRGSPSFFLATTTFGASFALVSLAFIATRRWATASRV